MPGSSWRDWDENLRADCHRKESGDTYSAVYARMEWNKPSPTITTQFLVLEQGDLVTLSKIEPFRYERVQFYKPFQENINLFLQLLLWDLKD